MDYLFEEKDLAVFLERQRKSAETYVDSIPEQQFLSTDDNVLLEHVLSKFEIAHIILYEESTSQNYKETTLIHDDYGRQVAVPGLEITVTIPFTGLAYLWKLRPNPWLTPLPRGSIEASGEENGCLNISFKRPSNVRTERFKEAISEVLERIRSLLENQRKEITRSNEALRIRVNKAIQERRERLKRHAKIVEELNIPLKRRDGAPDIQKFPIKRKLVKPLPPPVNEPPEPGVIAEDYEHILGVIRHEGRSFESTPVTFAVHDEEGLRNIILAHLNGHYQGDATGETFRKQGKTDIRIEDKNRAAFVGECKVWRGPKELTEAVDQLLGYLTWRDCKAALVIFNKYVAKFSSIQQKVPDTLQRHANCEKPLQCDISGEWRYYFRSKEDVDRGITVHVFLFNLYMPKL